MTSRERVITAINHEQSDKVPVDLGSAFETGIHAYAYKELKGSLGFASGNVEMVDMLQGLARVEEDVIERLNIDTVRFGAKYDPLGIAYGVGLKEWTMPNGLPCMVSKDFDPEKSEDGSYLIERGGNLFRCPENGFYFDAVKLAIAEARNIKDVEKVYGFGGLSEEEKEFYKDEASRLKDTQKAVVADLVIGFEIEYYFGYEKAFMNLLLNKTLMIDFIERLTDSYMLKFDLLKEIVGDAIDVLVIGKDLGNQNGSPINPKLVREVFFPSMKKYVTHVKENSKYYVMLHSCGSIYEFIPDIIDCGIDILNPIQIKAKNMEPDRLKREFGKYLCFWGGGIDTQNTLPFGSEKEVREQVRENARIFSKNGGYVFNPVHNIQPGVPGKNIIAAFDEINRFRRGQCGVI